MNEKTETFANRELGDRLGKDVDRREIIDRSFPPRGIGLVLGNP